MIASIVFFREIILQNSWNVSETTPRFKNPFNYNGFQHGSFLATNAPSNILKQSLKQRTILP